MTFVSAQPSAWPYHAGYSDNSLLSRVVMVESKLDGISLLPHRTIVCYTTQWVFSTEYKKWIISKDFCICTGWMTFVFGRLGISLTLSSFLRYRVDMLVYSLLNSHVSCYNVDREMQRSLIIKESRMWLYSFYSRWIWIKASFGMKNWSREYF